MTRVIAYLRIQLCIEKSIAEISERLASPSDLTKKEIQEMGELEKELTNLNANVIERKRL